MICDKINGHTKVIGIIGSPITHTFSPIIHNSISKSIGLNAVYVPFNVDEENLESAVKGAYSLNIEGLNVTMPHKKNIIDKLHSLDNMAEKIGAVNTIKYTQKGYIGYNTDYIGINNAFLNNGVYLENKNVVIIGAGGGAYSATINAAQSGAKKIYVVNRTMKNSYNVAQQANKYYNVDIETVELNEINSIKEPNIVVQTTSVGFSHLSNQSPVKDCTFWWNVETVMDIIYNPSETKLLKDAKKEGVKCINGFEMLVFQAIASYEIWFDVKVKEVNKILMSLRDYYES